MFTSWSALAVAGLALSANAAPGNDDLFKRQNKCNANNCYRAVVKAGQSPASSAARTAICSTFLLTTISGCATTTTASAPVVTSTLTITFTSGSTVTTTSVVTSSVVSTALQTSTTTTAIQFAKRAVAPVTGTVSQEPAACMPATTAQDTAVPTAYPGCAGSLAAFSNVCSCILSTLSSRQTTISAGTVTTTMTPTEVAVASFTTTTMATITEFSTTTASSTTTTTLIATQTVQPVSGQFYISTSEGSTVSSGDMASGFALRADMTNNAVYFTTDTMSKLKSGDLFARLPANDNLISLSTSATEAEKLTCACENQRARTGRLTCRSSTGAALLQVCADNSLNLAQSPIANCRAIIATCNPVGSA